MVAHKKEIKAGMNRPELAAGSFGAFEFGDTPSVDTKIGKMSRSGVSASGRTYKLDEESNFSLNTGDDCTDLRLLMAVGLVVGNTKKGERYLITCILEIGN